MEDLQTHILSAPNQGTELCNSSSTCTSCCAQQKNIQQDIEVVMNTFDAIRRTTIENNKHRFEELSEDQLDHITASMMQKVLALLHARLSNTDSAQTNTAQILHFLFCETPLLSSRNNEIGISEYTGDAYFMIESQEGNARPLSCPFMERLPSEK